MLVFILVWLLVGAADAQTTAFNFQGRLNDGTNPANGRYDLQFKLFNALTGGSQINATINKPNTMLVNGVFSTTLNFGLGSFTTGESRYIEISVRRTGSEDPHVILGARQQIMSVPFAVQATYAYQALHADNLGGVLYPEYIRRNVVNDGGVSLSGSVQAATLQTSGNAGVLGNLGVGTAAPTARLTVSGGPFWTNANWKSSINMQNASAIGWDRNGPGQLFGIGQTDTGLNFFRTISGFGTTLTPAETDLIVTNNGDVAQPLERNGLIKAMIAITADGTIARCYNGVTGVSTGNCGFTVTASTTGSRTLLLGFSLASRFLYVTADIEQTGGFGNAVVANAGIAIDGNAYVVLKDTGNTRVNSAFHVIVF